MPIILGILKLENEFLFFIFCNITWSKSFKEPKVFYHNKKIECKILGKSKTTKHICHLEIFLSLQQNHIWTHHIAYWTWLTNALLQTKESNKCK
jgi:hypothetical protein